LTCMSQLQEGLSQEDKTSKYPLSIEAVFKQGPFSMLALTLGRLCGRTSRQQGLSSIVVLRCQHQEASPWSSTSAKRPQEPLEVCGRTFAVDEWTNLTSRVVGFVGRDLHRKEHHPLAMVKERIVKV